MIVNIHGSEDVFALVFYVCFAECKHLRSPSIFSRLVSDRYDFRSPSVLA